MRELPGTKKVQRFLKGLVQGAMAMAAATCLLAPATAQAASSGSQLDPQDFVSLGTLSPASGTTLVFSTGATPPTISDGVNTYKGVNTVLTSGITTTVFCFDDINLQAGSVLDLSLTNNKPCALLSRTNIRVSTNINADASTRTSHAFGGYDGGNNGRNAGSTSPAFSTGGGKAGSTGNTCGGGEAPMAATAVAEDIVAALLQQVALSMATIRLQYFVGVLAVPVVRKTLPMAASAAPVVARCSYLLAERSPLMLAAPFHSEDKRLRPTMHPVVVAGLAARC